MTNITTLRPGEHFMFKNFEWVCLDPNHPDGGVLAIMAELWVKTMWFCPDERYADENWNWNNYKTSCVRAVLADLASYKFEKDSLLEHKVNLVADNGDRSYGAVKDRIFLLTCDEYRKYHDYIPRYNEEIWTATPQWCGNAYSSTGVAKAIRVINNKGQLSNRNAQVNCSIVPACILNPKFLNLRQSMAYVEEVSE